MLWNKKMLYLAPFIGWRGLSTATQASVLINFWVFIQTNTKAGKLKSEDEKTEFAMYTYIAFGIGTIPGAAVLGIL